MTISFSGLASGLDTSSWITSLTALKQAKVTVLQQEREELVVSKDTLSSIRSFFSSFRSVIERVTDTRFNIPALDLFAQNIAKSANLDVFTASATTEAEEGSYDITVKKLATKTKAISDYRYKTTITETTTATGDSYLKHIGITAGQVLINTPAGVQRTLEIEENETMSSLIEKFKEIGVNASYNDKSGVFTVDISASDINDIGATNIVDALHLQGVNEGYDSNVLQFKTVETVFYAASYDTKLSELGTGIAIPGTQTVVVKNSNNEELTINVDETTTIGQLFQQMNDFGLYATLSEEGVVEISGGSIVGGTFDAISALGLDSDPFTGYVVGEPLTETIWVYELVTMDTLLVDQLGVKEGYLEVEDSEGDKQYLKIYSGQTIGDLMADLANMGIYSTLDKETGVLTITGGAFTTLSDTDVNALVANGTIAEPDERYRHGTDLIELLYGAPAITVDQTQVSQTYAMSRALTYEVVHTINATTSTFMHELGVNTNEQVVIYNVEGAQSTINISGTTELGTLMNAINAVDGVTATLTDGILHIEGGYIRNTAVEEALGLDREEHAFSNVIGTQMSYTTIIQATKDTTLGQITHALGTSATVAGGYTLLYNSADVGVSADTTIQELMDRINDLGGTAFIDSTGRLTIDGGTLTGTVATALGFVTMSTTSSVSATGELLCTIATVSADSTTKVSELGLGDSTITIKGHDGVSIGTIDVNANMTIGDIFSALAGFGITGTIENGVISLQSDEKGYYAEGGFIDSIGIGKTTSTYTTTAGVTNTSSSAVTCSYTVIADGNTKLSELGYGASTITVKGHDGVTVGSIVVNGGMTLDGLMAALGGYEIAATLNNGIMTLKSEDGYYATGTLITAMGIGTTTSTYNTTTGTTGSSSAVVQYATTTYSTTFPTLTRTIFTTSTLVTTQPVIGSQTIIVTHTHTCTEVVGGTSTIYQTHTIVDTVPVIGSQTVVVTHTHVVTEPVIVPDAQVLSVTTPVTYTQYNFAPKTITLSGSQNVVSSSTVIVQEAVPQTVITTTTSTKTTPITSTVPGSTYPATTDVFIENLGLAVTNLSARALGDTGLAFMSAQFTVQVNITGSTTIQGVMDQLKSGGYNAEYNENTGRMTVSGGGGPAGGVGGIGYAANYDKDSDELTITDTSNGWYIDFNKRDSSVITTIDYETTTTTSTSTEVIEGSEPATICTTVTTPVTYSLTTIVTVLTGSTPMSVNAIGYVTVDSVTTTTRTVTTYTTHTVEKTTTKPVTHKIVTSDVIPTYTYKTVTHQSTTTHVVEKTGITVKTDTVIGTCVVQTTTYTITTTNSTATMTEESQLSQLGLTASGYVTVWSDGTLYTITAESSDTVGDLVASLAGLGIAGSVEGGKITLKGDKEAYITGISSALATALKLNTSYYSSSTHTITANTVGTISQKYTTTETLDTQATLSKYGITAGQVTVMSDGTSNVVTVSGADKLDDLFTQLASLGIYANVEGGIVTLKGDGQAYITGMTGLANLKLGATNYSTTTHTITANTSSNQQLETIYQTATGATTLGDLRHWDGSALSGYKFVLSTTSDAGNQNVTLAFSATTTLHQVIDRLADYGINANIDSAGRFTMSSSSLTDFDAGGAVGTFLMGAYTKKYDEGKLTHTSTNLIQETVVRMDENTKFSDIGVTTGDILLHIDGDIHTIHIDTNDTVGSFMQKLEDFNIEASIIDGQLALRGEHVVYTSAPDTNASNIIDKMNIGFDDWNLGSFSQTSDWLTDTEIRDDRITGDTKLVDLQDADGNSLNITTGEYVVYSNGVRTVETVTADTTIDDFITTMSTYAMVAETNSSGQLAVGAQHNSYLATAASSGDDTNLIDVLFAEWNFVNIYTSNNLDIPEDVTIAISETTKLADINEGAYEDGNFVITKDGVQTVVSLTADDTVGTLMDELELFGFETVINNSGQLIVKGTNATLSNYTGPNKASNILDIMNITSDEWVQTEIFHNDCLETSDVVTTWTNASEETLLENLDIAWTDPATNVVGDLMVTVDGSTSAIHIDAGESVGSLIEKFRSLGLEASISNGKLIVQSGYKDFVIETAGTTSNIINDFGLTYNADMGGYVASVAVCEQTTTRVEDRALSASSYASDSTLMSLLNITNGTLSVYRNGEKATILIKSDETFGQLRSRIATAFADVDIEFEDGYLKFYSNTGESIEVGSTTDTSNFSAICGLTNDKSGTVYSARELYSVNSASKITTAGLFRRDDVTEGTFIIGDATFTIDENTTMQNLISQINSSEDANAVAYWDSVDGRLVLTSRTTGSSFINVEAGTSNFTDVMGYTTTTRQADGITVDKTKLDIGAQEVGENAVFTINGTTYSSTSNTIESDISRITGVTINLKGLSEEGETVTLTVERDKETLANAVSDVVDAYNALIENVDKEVAKGAALSDQFTLKLIRNQIRNLMTSSLGSATVFKNMDAIGISLDKASTGNIDTSTINVLSFDKDKFFKAFEADQEAVKALVVGTDATQGILTKIETVVEQALTSASGYFSSADKSFNSQISRMDNKIKKAQEAVERYKARLETKFSAMDLLISKIQNQYSSFLGG